MRLLLLLISCLFLNSISQAQQLVARDKSRVPTNNRMFRRAVRLPAGYSCGERRYPLYIYRNQVQKKCKWFNSIIPFFRPKVFKSENLKFRHPGPYYKIPLDLKKKPSKERKPKYPDLAIVTRECTFLGIVAAIPKKLNFCDRIRRFCVKKFDYFECATN